MHYNKNNKRTMDYNNYRIFCLRFLKDNRCYNQFINNLINLNPKNFPLVNGLNILDSYVKSIYFSNDQGALIGRAFYWDETTETSSYWDNINLKFRKILNEFINGKKISYKK